MQARCLFLDSESGATSAFTRVFDAAMAPSRNDSGRKFRYVAAVPVGDARSVTLSGFMRIVSRAAAIVGVALALAAPARAACSGNCEPGVEDARAAMQQIFRVRDHRGEVRIHGAAVIRHRLVVPIGL